jgi:transmembrane sensor
MLAAYWWVDRAGEDLRITRALASEDVRVLSSGRAQQAVITLDDGSKVTLGAESKLTVPPGFGEEFRAVQLDGTASFTAASGQETPFQVRAHNAAIKATGTVFDVRAYETDSAVIVRVREGEVTVRVADTSRTLAAGRALAVAKDGSMREPSAQAVGEALGWTEGRLVIADRPLREVLPQMVRWHGLQIHVPDSSLLDRRVTMNAALASSREAIEALEQSAGVKFGYAGQVMILRDTAAMQPKARKPSRAR